MAESVGWIASAAPLPASPPATAPTSVPTAAPTGPATEPIEAPAAAPPAAPSPVPTGCDPAAPESGSAFVSCGGSAVFFPLSAMVTLLSAGLRVIENDFTIRI